MAEIFEGKGKTIAEAFTAMLGDLKKTGTMYAVQVADGDYVVGIKAVKPCITESHEWENDRKVFYRKQIEDCSDLVWANIKKGRHFYCFRDLPEQGFYAGNTYYCGNDSVITNQFGCGEVFNPIDVPFHFRLATQDEIEQYYIERRKNLDYGEEMHRRILESEDDDDD